MKPACNPIRPLFLLTEILLYILILTSDGSLLVVCSYLSIVLCFLYALLHVGKGHALMVGGLACTVAADYCLVVSSPIQQLWGMVFFLLAQILYAIKLHHANTCKLLLLIRGVLILLAESVAILVLGNKSDALALVSVCYYANLIMNILVSCLRFRENKLLSIGFVLFLLCDTVIGLQCASGSYLPIGENSILYKIIFMDFHLSWFFYLPSQVLIALSTAVQPSAQE